MVHDQLLGVELLGLGVHLFDEGGDAAGVVAGEGLGDVVGAFHEHGAEQLAAGVLLSLFDAEAHWSACQVFLMSVSR